MKKYRAEQIVKWLDKQDGWRLDKWLRKMFKELLKENYGKER